MFHNESYIKNFNDYYKDNVIEIIDEVDRNNSIDLIIKVKLGFKNVVKNHFYKKYKSLLSAKNPQKSEFYLNFKLF